MKASERHRAILDLVLTGDASVEQLSAALGVSEATVRRDLTTLANQRRLVRTYGGATALIGAHEPEASLEERKATQREQKEAIARAAAAHVHDGDTLLLDGGTTCAALARHLVSRVDLHVVTNNLLAVMTLANAPGVHLTLIGGDLRKSSMSTLGPLAELSLSRLSVDKAFLGADGVVAEFASGSKRATSVSEGLHHPACGPDVCARRRRQARPLAATTLDAARTGLALDHVEHGRRGASCAVQGARTRRGRDGRYGHAVAPDDLVILRDARSTTRRKGVGPSTTR